MVGRLWLLGCDLLGLALVCVWVWFWVGSLVVGEFAGVMGLTSLAVYFCFVGLV